MGRFRSRAAPAEDLARGNSTHPCGAEDAGHCRSCIPGDGICSAGLISATPESGSARQRSRVTSELHLYADDWGAHAHASDGRTTGSCSMSSCSRPARRAGAAGRRQSDPTLVLLPLLLHDLEEYAAEDALERLASPDRLAGHRRVGPAPGKHARAVLQTQRRSGGTQKTRFASRRIERLGWSEACHYAALEILGYRFNRTPMLRIATRTPLAVWPQERLTSARCSPRISTWSLQECGRPIILTCGSVSMPPGAGLSRTGPADW